MAVRKIEYRVDANGIQPAVKQFGGIQSEHKATELIFNIDPTLYENLREQLSDSARLIYRFDGYDGVGGVCRSDIGELTDMQVKYYLEEWLTRFGGIVKVVLVISLLKNDSTEMELFSFPALLQLKNLPEGTEVDGENYESMSVLAQVAKDSANIASNSAKVAVEAAEAIRNMENIAVDSVASAIKDNASGSLIHVNDVSPIEHNLAVKLKSKNLLNTDGFINNQFVKNEDGTYTFTKNSDSERFTEWVKFKAPIAVGTPIGLSLYQLGGTSNNLYAQIRNKDGTSDIIPLYPTNNGLNCVKAVAPSEVSEIRLYYDSSVVNGTNITFKEVQLELGNKLTECSPYVEDFSNVSVTRCGKNLIPYPYKSSTSTVNGVTFTDNGDGSITLDGTATADFRYNLVDSLILKPDVTYCFKRPNTVGLMYLDYEVENYHRLKYIGPVGEANRNVNVMTTPIDINTQSLQFRINNTKQGIRPFNFALVNSSEPLAELINNRDEIFQKDGIFYHTIYQWDVLHLVSMNDSKQPVLNVPKLDPTKAHTIGFKKIDSDWWLVLDGSVVFNLTQNEPEIVHTNLEKLSASGKAYIHLASYADNLNVSGLRIIDNITGESIDGGAGKPFARTDSSLWEWHSRWMRFTGGVFTWNKDFKFTSLYLDIKSSTTFNNKRIYPMLEIGSTASDYEAYKGKTVTANADGTVEGITSVSPNMILFTNTKDVVIDLNYNVDTKTYIDKKFAELSKAILNN